MTTYKLISFIIAILLTVIGLGFLVASLREAIHSDNLFGTLFGSLMGIVLIIASIAIYQSLWEF